MTKIDVLDHGYVALVETWGSDERIIEAARMSTDKGFQGWEPEVEYRCTKCGYIRTTHRAVNEHFRCPTSNCDVELPYRLVHHGDEKLLRYLWTHKHHTPFEMGGMTIEVQAPIFVFREWHRHRTQSYNELSARYTPLPDMFYVPSDERMMMGKQSTTNKQSSEAATFTSSQVSIFKNWILESQDHARRHYEALLASGVSRELARVVIPVSQYSRMRASANLRNWLGFLTLRMDEAAQWEIRQFAEAVGTLIAEAFPRTWELFEGGRS